MSMQLLEIQPKELKFIFKLKKQSSCSVWLTNNTYNNVAFKVKTTSPMKYCVRPNIGVVMPKSTCEFTVTMQAQKVAPQGLVCKDKFLIQSTVVPIGTTDNDITASTFSKDDGKYIEESKLKVALVSPPQSPMLSPINGDFKQGPFFKASVLEDPVLSRIEVLTPPHMLAKDVEFKNKNSTSSGLPSQEFDTGKDAELKPIKESDVSMGSKSTINIEFLPNKDVVNGRDMKLADNGEFVPTRDLVHHEEMKPTNNGEFVPKKDVACLEEIKPANNGEFLRKREVPHHEEIKPADFGAVVPKRDVVHCEEIMPANNGEFEPKRDAIHDEETKLANTAEFALNRDVVNDEDIKLGKNDEPKPEKHTVNGEQLKAENEDLRLGKNDELKPETLTVNGEQLKAEKCENLKPEKRAINGNGLKPTKDVEFRTVRSVEELKIANDIKEMKSKLNALELKLNEAESTISKLTEERRVSIAERKLLQQELAVLRRGTNNRRKVQVGFPLLFVVMVALISTVLGYLSHP